LYKVNVLSDNEGTKSVFILLNELYNLFVWFQAGPLNIKMC